MNICECGAPLHETKLSLREMLHSCAQCGRLLHSSVKQILAPTEHALGQFAVTVRELEQGGVYLQADKAEDIVFPCPQCGRSMEQGEKEAFGPVVCVDLSCLSCGIERAGIAEFISPK
jgi:predicted RNA-binding Zn-ribbon protein involved in translation (DUF1610 family)